jgi:prepilin-type N-terminal cleavage/methylation domain-containing protein
MRSQNCRGFTLTEVLVVLAILGIIAAFGIPALQDMIQRSKLLGIAEQTSATLRRARFEAIKRNRPAVVRIDGSGDQLVIVAFIDVDGVEGSANEDLPDLIFNPHSGKAPRETDYELQRLSVPARVTQTTPDGSDSVEGFTADPGGGASNIAVFDPDGSLRNVGAFRFADAVGNFIEVRAAPASTGRVTLQKWQDGGWLEQGLSGGESWQWKT